MASAQSVLTLGSPWSPRTLHRVASYLLGYDDLSLVCIRRARCSSLAARASASSSCYRARGSLPLPHLTLASRSPAVRDVKSSHDVSNEFPKTAPSPSWEPRSPLPRARSRARFGDWSPTASLVPPSWFSTTLTACSSSTLSGSCTGVPVLGFVTFPAVRRCLSRHGILPFEALLPAHSGLTRGWRTILAPGRRHLGSSPSSPSALPPRPWFPWTSRRCSMCRALSYEVLPPLQDRCSLGLVRLPAACTWRVHRSPRSRSGSGLTSSRWIGTSGPEERQRSPTGPARLAWMLRSALARLHRIPCLVAGAAGLPGRCPHTGAFSSDGPSTVRPVSGCPVSGCRSRLLSCQPPFPASSRFEIGRAHV